LGEAPCVREKRKSKGKRGTGESPGGSTKADVRPPGHSVPRGDEQPLEAALRSGRPGKNCKKGQGDRMHAKESDDLAETGHSGGDHRQLDGGKAKGEKKVRGGGLNVIGGKGQ